MTSLSVFCLFLLAAFDAAMRTNADVQSWKIGTKNQKMNSSFTIDEDSDLFTEFSSKSDMIFDLAISLRKLSCFIAENAQSGNDDLFFTLRMAQGQLWQLRAQAPQWFLDAEVEPLLTGTEADLFRAGKLLHENFKRSSKLGPEFEFIMDPKRGQALKRLNSTSAIKNFKEAWMLAYELNLLKAGSVIEFRPATSDRCLRQLQPTSNTQELTSAGSHHCVVDSPCWLMMTKPGTSGYYLTHQVMFLALGETAGCGPDFEALGRQYFGSLLPRGASPLTPDIIRGQCLSALSEARAIALTGYPDILRDMFLEQGFLCGAAVYMPEFFEPSWIQTVISWQKPSGCFGFNSSEYFAQMDVRKETIWADNIGNAKQNNEITAPDSLAQNSRRERQMTQFCYAHNTGVALGYLSVALRYVAV